LNDILQVCTAQDLAPLAILATCTHAFAKLEKIAMAKKIIPLKKLTSPGTWVQTERAGHQAWAQLSVQSPRACQLLHLLIAHMDKSGALVASHLTLAGLMKSSVATTKRALAVLTEQAWIQTIRLGSERGGVLAYVINCRVAWADARDNLRFARFNARVLVSSKDQDDLGNGALQPPPLTGMANIYPPDLVELDAEPQQSPQAIQETHV
jgi:hypothetical protein